MWHTVFDGDDVAVPERFEAWRTWCDRTLAPTVLDRVGCETPPGGFRAVLRVLELGPAHMADPTYGPLRARRTPRLIRATGPECYQLALIRAGRQSYADASHDVVLGPGDLMLFDSSRPYTARVPAAVAHSSLIAQVPRRLVPLPENRVRPLIGVPVPAQDPVARLLCQFLGGVTAEHARRRPDGLTGADAVRLGGVALDLITALLARRLGDPPSPAAGTRRETLLLRVQTYVDRHLADPDLPPAAVAAAHHISVRCLHRLFEEQGTGVAAWIRGKRLERCRRDLADPALADRPVRAIAARWGFPRPSDFGRAFRDAYGVPPGEYRRHCAARP
ncbi:helix-turn-helix domain-containing protein [Streptomyces sp. NPDC006134]|uniref:helix-turn-helix domain-containing protein n=1 Tax=Streptomyces sp. NPDC006134 TaxID=3154467 RepID=UPI0033F2FD59